jgi:hypothetical protein
LAEDAVAVNWNVPPYATDERPEFGTTMDSFPEALEKTIFC